MSEQLSLFPVMTEVKQENLEEWAYEVGRHSPLGEFLYLLHCQLPSGFVDLLHYRAGNDEDEDAAEKMLFLDEWYKELGAYNMVRLESESE